MKIIAVLWVSLVSLFAQGQLPAWKAEILRTVRQQERAWNRGELEGFMEGYWHSDSLRFVTSRGITYGWEATLERYRSAYPTRKKMGQLRFSELELKRLGRQYALVTGRWELTGLPGEPHSGYFTLLWQKINGRWLIVRDHTS